MRMTARKAIGLFHYVFILLFPFGILIICSECQEEPKRRTTGVADYSEIQISDKDPFSALKKKIANSTTFDVFSSTKSEMYLLSNETLKHKNTWTHFACDGYIFLLASGKDLVQHAATTHAKIDRANPLWNYKAHYIVVLSDDGDYNPEDLVGLYNFRKTENLVILQTKGKIVKIWSHDLINHVVALELVDSWMHGMFQKGNNIFPPKFSNFRGNSLKVATFELAPFAIFKRDENGTIQERIGVDMQVIKGLSKAKNFTVKYTEVSNNEKWGKKRSDGSWDGLIGEVVREKSNISLLNIFIDGPRWGVVDYSTPYNYMPACFVAPSPKPLPHWRSPILPFTWDTWTSIGIFLLGSGIAMLFISTMSIKPEPTDFRSLSYSYLYIVGALTSRALGTTPHHMPSRLYAGFLWIFGLVVCIAYSANLMAFLLVTQVEPPIKTMEQLAKSGLRIAGHSLWKSLFDMSNEKATIELGRKMELLYNYEKLFLQVEAGKYAFIQNRQFLELNRDTRFTHGSRSSIRIVEECFMNYNVALTLPRNSPLTDSLTSSLMRIFESGLLHHWKKEVVKYFTLRYAEERAAIKKESGTNPLNLGHVQGIFYILIIGCLSSVVMLALEIARTNAFKQRRMMF